MGKKAAKKQSAARNASKAEPPGGSAFASALARALIDIKAEKVRALDVRGLTDVTDFLVIATALSERQLSAMAAAIEEAVASAGRTLIGTEGTGASGWMVVDTGDVVSHLLTGAARSYYDLDGLWADAKEVDPLVTSGKGDA